MCLPESVPPMLSSKGKMVAPHLVQVRTSNQAGLLLFHSLLNGEGNCNSLCAHSGQDAVLKMLIPEPKYSLQKV